MYVNGSFISRSDVRHVPFVSLEESFDCPLGYVRSSYTYVPFTVMSIRMMYHPRSKKVSQSGFYTKTTNHVFSQWITISSSKKLPIENVRIIDKAPVSEDSGHGITVYTVLGVCTELQLYYVQLSVCRTLVVTS